MRARLLNVRLGSRNHLIAAGAMACAAALMALSGCGAGGSAAKRESVAALPDSAYYADSGLGEWIDPDTGYDTTREWTIDGDTWPVALIMSPSQSPQLLLGDSEGLYQDALRPYGITPVMEKIEIPARTFHALQRSKWAFVYMPYAVFTDYCRTNDNQGGAGGLQYVALAGSTQGGGYTLITQDPAIQSVADLAGKKVAGLESNPARIVLMRAAAEQAGLKLGQGEGEIGFSTGASADDVNDYLAGKCDALIVLSIVKDRFLRTGSRVVSDFTDVGYTPNYTILCVDRSVLDERPDVVDAFLEAHYQANLLAERMPADGLRQVLMDSWNGYFESQETTAAAQRIVPDLAAFETLLGNMGPEQRIDPALLDDCFAYLDDNEAWGWNGQVDRTRLLALERYNKILESHGEKSQ